VNTDRTFADRRSAWIRVDDQAIRDNVSSITAWLRPSRCLAVVKANGYGHGLLTASKAALAGGAESLGVALPEEGVALRKAGVNAPILVLGASLPDAADTLIEFDLAQTVTDRGMLDALNRSAKQQRKVAAVHLKTDTGMGRVGAPPSGMSSLLEHARALPCIRVDALSTHIGWEDDDRIDSQVEAFRRIVASTGCRAHATNSLVALRSAPSHFDTTRIGLLLYGVVPQPLFDARLPIPKSLKLRPALSMEARITQLRNASPGQTVSYGGTFTVDRPSRLGILPVGYADGYPRGLSNRGHVLVRGRPCPVRGSVCMDQAVIDLTDCPDARLGDTITLVGISESESITINDLARAAGTIPHDILAGLGSRLPRVATPP